MNSLRPLRVRAWRALERFEAGSAAGPVLFAIALASYAFVAIAFPVAAGRDLGTYLRAAFELRSSEIVLPAAFLGRAPVTGVFSEAVLSIGPLAAEGAMALLYAVSILCWWRAARRLGPAVGIAVTLVLLAYPSYALLFHRLASDALFAAAFALAALIATRLVERPTYGRCVAVGAALALLVLVRPVSQVLLVLVPLVVFLPGVWPRRFGRLAAVGAAAIVPLLAWAGHNAVRADDVTVVRGAGYGLPLYRAFVVDRIVDPSNGEATRELAGAVREDLLAREPYRSYEIGLDEFFSSGSARMHEDLIGLSDRTWGWDDDYARLARVGREAVRAHPATYARGVARDTWRLLWWPVFLSSGVEPSAARQLAASTQLPEPTEGQPIPSASVSGFISTPDERFREVWTSATEHGIVADDPADSRHLDRVNRRVAELYTRFPDRSGSAGLAAWLDSASRWFPRLAVWLVVGLVALAVRRPRGMAIPLVLATAALLVIVGTSLAVPAAAEYAAPVAPAVFLLAAFGLLGDTSSRRLGSVPSP